MKKHIAVATLLLGAVLASGSTFAAGRSANDGGPVDVSAPPPKAVRPIATPAHFGKGLNDGGTVDNINGAVPKITWVKNPPHVGRALNDGGF